MNPKISMINPYTIKNIDAGAMEQQNLISRDDLVERSVFFSLQLELAHRKNEGFVAL